MSRPAGAVVGIGTDLVEVERMRRLLDQRSGAVRRLFTELEQVYAQQRRDPAERYAVRFAAKEAVMKALGVGLGAVRFRDIEVANAESGAPSLTLTGAALARSDELGIGVWHLTLSHTSSMAQAVAIAVAR